MGVGRASFYNAFESKRGVFLRSLDLYFETVDAHLAALLANATDCDSAVAALIDGILAVARSTESTITGWRGCLIGNTALEVAAHDGEIVDRLKIGVEVLRARRVIRFGTRPFRPRGNGSVDLLRTGRHSPDYDASD
jgi:TetR/AcrR family transcriptional repressor of nem operon